MLEGSDQSTKLVLSLAWIRAQKPVAKWQQGEVKRWLGWLGLQQAESLPLFQGLDGKASPARLSCYEACHS